ncbi:MAG: GNAT family N-acetyltransferase [Firmicutes bacterium]|nr:GNAT family N-acetyltransferase [Bacillota bacterium]
MKVINLKNNINYLKEYFLLCSMEWGNPKTKEEMEIYVNKKINSLQNNDKLISVLGLVENELIGFISLFKYDGDERKDLTPWYATMYVKKEYRGKGYSKILNDTILNEAKTLGYGKVYLKSDLINYYEKFGAKYIEKLNNGENLYYIEL